MSGQGELRDQLAMAALTGIADAMLEARAERVRCAKLAETVPFVYVAVPGAGAYVDEAATRASMVRAIMGQS